jgi:hypothetical protein
MSGVNWVNGLKDLRAMKWRGGDAMARVGKAYFTHLTPFTQFTPFTPLIRLR